MEVYICCGWALRVRIPDHENTGYARLHFRIHQDRSIAFVTQL